METHTIARCDISRRAFLSRSARVAATIGTASLAQLGLALEGAPPSKPNVLLIFSDDMGCSDVGCFGSKIIKTPNLDRLATEGVRFTQFYTNAPICVPSRISLMTGRYPFRDDMDSSLVEERAGTLPSGLPSNVPTLAEALKKLGYATGLIGKWHLGEIKEEFRPLARGFDQFYGLLGGAHDYYTHKFGGHLDLWRQDKLVEEEGYTTQLLTREALAFLDRHRDSARPFFLYLAYTAPHMAPASHTPFQAPEEFVVPYRSLIDDPQRQTYAGMVTCLDDSIGKVLARLEENGFAENTIVFFLNDNGGPTELGVTNHPFRDGKHSLHEGGIRTPMIVRWPGQIPANAAVSEIGIAMDIFTTSLLAAGGTLSSDSPIDGQDLLPVAQGRTKRAHEFLVWRSVWPSAERRAIRDGEWKLVELGDERFELYNLINDPGESKNLSVDHPDQLKRLRENLERLCPPFANWDALQQQRSDIKQRS